MAEQVRSKMAPFYTLLCDETRDISKKEQMSIVLRYVKEASVYERFLCYVYVDELDANSLTKFIVETLDKYGIQLQNCVSQGYDGASVMSGTCTGVQTRMKAHCPKAVYIHCCAHRLNLVLVDSTRSIQMSAEFFKLLEWIYVFMSHPIPHKYFLEAQEKLRPQKQVITIKRLVETCWACKHDAVESMYVVYSSLIYALEEINTRDYNNSVEAKGLLLQLKSFEFIVPLIVFRKILKITKSLSDALQCRDLDLSAASGLVTASIEALQACRSTQCWDTLWEKCIAFANDNNVSVDSEALVQLSIHSTRVRTLPARLSDSIVTTTTGWYVK